MKKGLDNLLILSRYQDNILNVLPHQFRGFFCKYELLRNLMPTTRTREKSKACHVQLWLIHFSHFLFSLQAIQHACSSHQWWWLQWRPTAGSASSASAATFVEPQRTTWAFLWYSQFMCPLCFQKECVGGRLLLKKLSIPVNMKETQAPSLFNVYM